MEEPASSGAAGEPQSAGVESGQPGAGGGPDDTVERSGPSALVPRILARPPRKAKPQGVRVLEPKESMRNRLRKALAPYLTATYWQVGGDWPRVGRCRSEAGLAAPIGAHAAPRPHI